MGRDDSLLLDRMIFLVGAQRSGTNWLQRIIAAHPNVAAVPSETYLFSHGIAPIAERIRHGAASSGTTGFVYMDRQRFLDAMREFCDAVFGQLLSIRDPHASRLVERTPAHVAYLDLIGDIYPDARFVHIIRDGRDVVRSLTSQDWGPTSAEEAAHLWRNDVQAGRVAGQKLPHYMEVRYEDLIADPDAHARSLLAWLGLPVTDEIMRSIALEAGIAFNVDPSSPRIGTEKWKKSLTKTDLESVTRVAGPLLSELAYHEGLPEEPKARRRVGTMAFRGHFSEIRQRTSRTFDREALRRVRNGDVVFASLLEAIARQQLELLDEIIAPAANIRVVGFGEDWQGRGLEAQQRFRRLLSEDPALKRRQLSGDVHPGLPMFTFVGTYAGANGSVHHRVIAAAIHGDIVERIAYYRLD